jgi:hypothetical protein
MKNSINDDNFKSKKNKDRPMFNIEENENETTGNFIRVNLKR